MTFAEDLAAIGRQADLALAAAREAAAAASAELAVALTRIRELEQGQAPAEPPPTPSGRCVMLWHNVWEAPLISDYPADALDILTNVTICNMQSAGAGTGRLQLTPTRGTPAQFKASTTALKARGIEAMVGIGGAGAGGVTITTTTQVQQAFDSIAAVVRDYGVNGLNLDLEPGSSTWTEQAVVALVDKLQATHPGFTVALTVGLYGEHTARWLSLARVLGPRLRWFVPMLYDFPESRDSRFTAVVLDKCRTMVGGGVKPEQIVLGYMSRTAKDSGYNAGTPQVILDAHRAALAQWPAIAGCSIWQQKYEGLTNWELTRSVGALVRR